MTPTLETDEYLEYTEDGVTYRVNKTDPPTVCIVFDFGHPRLKAEGKPQTWLGLKALFDVQEKFV